jgi:hypothetical protein
VHIERVRTIALRNQLERMPEFRIEQPESNLPVGLRKFIGIWASEVGFHGIRGGRQAMLVITDVDPSGRAEGFYVWGSPSAATPPTFGPGYAHFIGKIAGDQLSFQESGYEVTVIYADRNRLSLLQRRTDGSTAKIYVEPVWRLVESENPPPARIDNRPTVGTTAHSTKHR